MEEGEKLRPKFPFENTLITIAMLTVVGEIMVTLITVPHSPLPVNTVFSNVEC